MNWVRIEEKLNVLSETTYVSVYDFDFERYFNCTHPYMLDSKELCVARIGAIPNYQEVYKEKLELGLQLINSPEQHILSSELPAWYSYIKDLTPKSYWFDTFPPIEEVKELFTFPIFVKGSRQTSKHNPDLSIIRDEQHYKEIILRYQLDPILHWQQIIIREFEKLEPVKGSIAGKLRPSLEFRSFWWQGICVGWGQYWYQLPSYATSNIDVGLALAQEAAKRLNVPFLVIDLAKTIDGRWIIIECNDAQESGYVSIEPRELWKNVLTRVGL